MPLLKYQRNRLIIMIIIALLGGVVVLMMRGVIPGFQKDRVPAGPTGPAPLTLYLPHQKLQLSFSEHPHTSL